MGTQTSNNTFTNEANRLLFNVKNTPSVCLVVEGVLSGSQDDLGLFFLLEDLIAQRTKLGLTTDVRLMILASKDPDQLLSQSLSTEGSNLYDNDYRSIRQSLTQTAQRKFIAMKQLQMISNSFTEYREVNVAVRAAPAAAYQSDTIGITLSNGDQIEEARWVIAPHQIGTQPHMCLSFVVADSMANQAQKTFDALWLRSQILSEDDLLTLGERSLERLNTLVNTDCMVN